MKRMLIAAALLGWVANVNAAPITPTFTSFGTLATATFGGTGIPNTAVAVTTVVDQGNTITLGLTATPRFDDPAVGNNGAGTFTAQPGSDAAHGQPGYALWNFD